MGRSHGGIAPFYIAIVGMFLCGLLIFIVSDFSPPDATSPNATGLPLADSQSLEPSTESSQGSVAVALAPPQGTSSSLASATPLSSTVVPTPTSEQIIATDTPQPTQTSVPSATSTEVLVVNYTQGSANIRRCPRTSCDVVASLAPGEEVMIGSAVEGELVLGSTTWRNVLYRGQLGFIHGTLVDGVPPPTYIPPTFTRIPLAPVATRPPVVQPAAPNFSCNCSKTCDAMQSCQEAYFQLNDCGCGRRDGDGDGVPCETICPGG